MDDYKDTLGTGHLYIEPARSKDPPMDEKIPSISSDQVSFLPSQAQDQLGRTRYQILAAFLSCTSLLSAGLAFGWPACALVQLYDKSLGSTITPSEGVWIVSGVQMGACLGNLLTVAVLSRIGRRTTHLISAIPYLLGWMLLYKSRSFVWLFVGRIIAGTAIGANFTVLPIYLGEIAENRLRGRLVSFMGLLVITGFVLALIIGGWFFKEAVAVMGFTTVIFFASTFFWMPETPYYYLSRNQTHSAEKSLSWLRGSDKIQEELQEMEKFQDTGKMLRGKLLELVTVPGNRKATLILVVTFAAQQLSGHAVMIGYVGFMLHQTSLKMDPKLAIAFAGCLIFVGNVIMFFLADRVGRKRLILLSSFGTIVALFTVGMYFHLLNQNPPSDSHRFSWLMVAGIFGFYVFHSIGLESVPCSLMSEMYPTSAKPSVSTIAALYGSFLAVCTTYAYQALTDTVGSDIFFFACGCIQCMLLVVMAFILPETKGQSFRSIQNTLAGKKKTVKI